MNKTYPSSRRLRKTWEYQHLRKMGCKFNTSHFVLLIAAGLANESRLGITVSRKVGNAVQRNRVKRVIREFFRNYYFSNIEPFDYSVIAKNGAADVTSRKIILELKRVFIKSARKND